MQGPEFWREEIWHPLSVHLPIASIILATFFKLLSLKFKTYTNTTSILIFGSGVFCWISYYTGSLADGIVSRTLCDPTVLKTHENYAYYLSILISLVMVLEVFRLISIFNYKKLINYLIIMSLILSSAGVAYVGHLGATLVYQQAAGVYTPSENCGEFE